MTPLWATAVAESIRVELKEVSNNQVVLRKCSNCLGLGSRGAARTSLLVCVLAKVLVCLVQRRTVLRDVRDTDEVSARVR